MRKRIILAVMLTASMAGSALSACGSGGEGAESPAQAGGNAPASGTQGGASEMPSGTGESTNAGGCANLPKSDVADGAADQQTYPISDEKITLTMWYPMAGSMGERADFNDSEFWQWYEEKTNIHIKFIVPASGTEKDSFNLLFASGDMPDLVYSHPARYGTYRGGEDAAIEDGYFVNMVVFV